MREKLYCSALRVMVGVVLCVPVFGQGQTNKVAEEAYQFFNSEYGHNPALVNGKYFVDLSLHDLGHPYFINKKYEKGYLLLQNTVYDNYEVMYNVFNQTLVIRYSNDENAPFAFVPPHGFVTEFSMLADTFYYYNDTNALLGYYKKLYTSDEVECLVQYNKTRAVSHHNESFSAFKYSDIKHTYYYKNKASVTELTKKKDLLMYYPEDQQKAIGDYMKAEKIKIRRASEETIRTLITFCENL